MPVDSGGNQVVGLAVAGAAVTAGNPVQVNLAGLIAGEPGSSTQLAVNTEGIKASYSASVNAHAPAATPTDWFTILGSATKTVRITRIRIQTRATTGNQYRIAIRKYSTAYSAGTAAAVTIVPHDSGSAAATAVVNTWASGLPTIGTPVGSIEDESLPQAVLATPAAGLFPYIYDWGVRNGQNIVLRGITQYVALWSNAVALPGGFVADVKIEWTEE